MKSPRLLAIATFLLMGLLALPTALGANAHDMTAMQATPADPLAGVTVVGLGAVQPAVAPGETLQLLRLTLDPGVTISMHHHPGPVIISVESGVFITSFEQSTAVITRSGAAADATPEAVDPGEEYTLNAGDTVSYDADTMGHVMKNGGTDPLVLIASVLFEDGQPGFIFETATPTS
jgi:quercetin dioxygenase-like cupin family protein